MVRVSDDERREVAEGLRFLAEGVDQVSAFDIAKTLRLEALSWWGYDAEDVDRLADLIEPCDTSHSRRDTVAGESGQNRDKNLDSVPIESPAVQKAPACDREALLALAEEIHGLVENQEIRFFHVVQVHESTLATIEARIREACGEVVA